MKLYNQCKKYGRKAAVTVGAAGTSLMLTAGPAMAALSTEVTTEMGTAKTDAVALASLGLLIIIAIAAVKYLRRGV